MRYFEPYDAMILQLHPFITAAMAKLPAALWGLFIIL
jgi:hypothetical protein